MKLTPLDIRKQEFSRRVRGIDEEEVKAFLQMVASQWEEVHDEFRRLEDKVRDLDGKLDHYKRVEEALQEALRTARENAKEALETARQKAQIIVQEAETSAIHIKRDADDERRKMKRQIARLSHRRDEIVSRLRAFLMSEMEMLARYEGDDAVGFIKLMPAQERQLQDARDRADFADEDAFTESDDPTDAKDEAPPGQTAEADLPADDPATIDEEPDVVAPLPEWATFRGDDVPGPVSEQGAPDANLREVEGETVSQGFDLVSEESEGNRGPAQDHVEPSGHVDLDARSTDVNDLASSVEADVSDGETEAESLEDGAQYTHEGVDDEHDADALTSNGLWSAEAADASASVNDQGEKDASPKPPSAQSLSKWLNKSLNAFKGGEDSATPSDTHEVEAEPDTHANTDETHRTKPSQSTQGSIPRNEEHEEEESFTVSSEEVERIRRILKGLD